MGTAIQKTSGSGTGDRGSVHQYSGSESRVPNHDSRVLCDSESQSCYVATPENQPLFTPATKVIGGVLAAGTAGAIGLWSLVPDGVEGDVQIAEGLIENADSALSEDKLSDAAGHLERAAEILVQNPAATDELRKRALSLLDRAIEYRGKVAARLLGAPEGSSITDILASPQTGRDKAHALIQATKIATVELKKSDLFQALGEADQGTQAQLRAVNIFTGIIDRQSVPQNVKSKEGDSLVSETSGVLLSIAQRYLATGQYDRALRAAEDAAALRGIAAQNSDFPTVDAEPFYQQLKTNYLLARMFLLNEPTPETATAAVFRFENMALAYAKAGSARGIAWALGERAKAFSTEGDEKFRLMYYSAFSYHLSGVWYRLAAIDPEFSLRINDISISQLLNVETNPLDQSADLTQKSREMLSQSSVQFSRALELLEKLPADEIDNTGKKLKITLAKDISETEEILGNLEAAAKAQKKLADITAEQMRQLNDPAMKNEIARVLIKAREKAAQLWDKAITLAHMEEDQRLVLRLTFDLEAALMEYKTAAMSSNLPNDEKLTIKTDTESIMRMLWNNRLEAFKKTIPGKDVDFGAASAADVQNFFYSSHLRELALRVSVGDAAAYRDFVTLAANAVATTPEEIAKAITGRTGDAWTRMANFLDHETFLLGALNRAATNPQFGRGRDAKPRDRDVVREARR